MTRRFLRVLLVAAALTGSAAFGAPASADEFRDRQWHLDFLKANAAHEISTGEGVTVAVVDSGVAKHRDLEGSVLTGTDFVKNGNGRTDLTGHGTSMAGLIAAHGANNRGAYGIAPKAKILPIRILGRSRTNTDLGPAIRYAISHGAKVINLSVGGGTDPDDLAAIQEAADADVVVIAAAGNKPEAAAISAPAFLDSVVAVGAVDRSGRKADISVTGKALDLTAPGEDITSTNNKGGYIVGQQGTSDAAAIVSGAAALLRSRFPEMSAEEVVERLQETAIDKGAPGVDPEYGHGILNIVAALSDDTAPAGQTSVPATQPATTAPTTEAAPETEPAGNSTPLIAGGITIAALAAAGAALWFRKRRTNGTA